MGEGGELVVCGEELDIFPVVVLEVIDVDLRFLDETALRRPFPFEFGTTLGLLASRLGAALSMEVTGDGPSRIAIGTRRRIGGGWFSLPLLRDAVLPPAFLDVGVSTIVIGIRRRLGEFVVTEGPALEVEAAGGVGLDL